jgi:hypothetical protein
MLYGGFECLPHKMASDPSKMHGHLLQTVLAASTPHSGALKAERKQTSASDLDLDEEEKIAAASALSDSKQKPNHKTVSRIIPVDYAPLICNEYRRQVSADSSDHIEQRLRTVAEQAAAAHTRANSAHAAVQQVESNVDEWYDRLTRKLERTTSLQQLEAIIIAVSDQSPS